MAHILNKGRSFTHKQYVYSGGYVSDWITVYLAMAEKETLLKVARQAADELKLRDLLTTPVCDLPSTPEVNEKLFEWQMRLADLALSRKGNPGLKLL